MDPDSEDMVQLTSDQCEVSRTGFISIRAEGGSAWVTIIQDRSGFQSSRWYSCLVGYDGQWWWSSTPHCWPIHHLWLQQRKPCDYQYFQSTVPSSFTSLNSSIMMTLPFSQWHTVYAFHFSLCCVQGRVYARYTLPFPQSFLLSISTSYFKTSKGWRTVTMLLLWPYNN